MYRYIYIYLSIIYYIDYIYYICYMWVITATFKPRCDFCLEDL